MGTRGRPYIFLINHRVRLRAGVPIMHAETKMRHYDVADPYRRDYEYYKNHVTALSTPTVFQ